MAEALLAARPTQRKAEAGGACPACARHAALERRPAVRAEAGLRSLLEARAPAGPAPIQRAAAPNRTGLPNRLKAGVEALSGVSLDHVAVHYNSSQPAQLGALAYAQGRDIHLASGQEGHLAHEAWHVVQQARGRVRPTLNLKSGVRVNDDEGLEREADLMGRRAAAGTAGSTRATGGEAAQPAFHPAPVAEPTVQRMVLPVWANDKDRRDFLQQGEKQSTLLRHGKVINIGNFLVDKNLKGIADFEDLHIIGHGSPETVAGMPPAELALFVVKRLGLPASYEGRIYLETCNSGTTTSELESSYAERFLAALAELRPESKPLAAMSYKGGVILDDTFPGHPTMRVLREGMEMPEFKAGAMKAMARAQTIIGKFNEKIRSEDLNYYVGEGEIMELFFMCYDKNISKMAEPAGGRLTQYLTEGKDYEGLGESTNAAAFAAKILAKARKEKAEIDAIEVKPLDLGSL
jgi:hypothetical protein